MDSVERRRFGAWLALLLVGAAPVDHAAACPAAAPWSRLPDTGSELLGPGPLLLTTGAFTAPFAMAPTGVDHDLRRLAQTSLGGRHDREPVSLLAPYVMTGGLIFGVALAASLEECEWQRPQAAILQAVVLTAGTVALLKYATGRTWPNAGRDPNAPDRLDHPEWARQFRPWREGLAAWPSGHTAVMTAAAAALRTSAAEIGFVRFLGYPLALGVAAGMWLGDHHWASDILSGALLGEAIGGAAGRSFSSDPEQPTVGLVPTELGWVLVYAGQW